MVTEGDGSYFFQSRLTSLPEAFIALSSVFRSLSEAEQKKRARLEISLQHTSEKIGFLHASLIRVAGKHFLLAGPSHVGKTTYGSFLVEKLGGEILAQDWIGVEKEGSEFYISDINFSEKLKQTERNKLNGVFFLIPEDSLYRDAFVPNTEEFLYQLKSTFDTASPEELAILSTFWEVNRTHLPFYCVVPTHQNSIEYVGGTLARLIERQKMSWNKVGVIGLGSIGPELAYALGELSQTEKVHFYSRSPEKAIGYAMDMNQALANRDRQVFVAHQDPAEIFREAEVIFLCFRDTTTQIAKTDPEQERSARLAGHAQIIKEYAVLASRENFQGTLFVITNPVDILTYILYFASQSEKNPLRTFQVYGSGLEVDLARALYFLEQQGYHFSAEEIRIFGNHSGQIVIESPLEEVENDELTKKVQTASQLLRSYVPRTVYGPVAAVIKNYKALKESTQTNLAVLQQQTFMGMSIVFQQGLPMTPKEGSSPDFASILEQNKTTTRSL